MKDVREELRDRGKEIEKRKQEVHGKNTGAVKEEWDV